MVNPDPQSPPTDADEARKKFEVDLISRGEAATRDPGDLLPPGATHEILPDSPGDAAPPKIVRRRFNLV